MEEGSRKTDLSAEDDEWPCEIAHEKKNESPIGTASKISFVAKHLQPVALFIEIKELETPPF